MKVIPLKDSKLVALVDDESYDILSKFNWRLNNKGYVVSGHSRLMHRLVASTPSGLQTDHKDGDKLNNQSGNLRHATNAQNQWNRPIRKTNTSGHKHIAWNSLNKNWRVRFYVNRQAHEVGSYPTITEAIEARDKAIFALHGEFTRL